MKITTHSSSPTSAQRCHVHRLRRLSASEVDVRPKIIGSLYTKRLKEENIFQSMSHKGNHLDDSAMENFFGGLMQEIYYGRIYHSYKEAKTTIEDILSTITSAASICLFHSCYP